jgi:hypothetical protein
MDMKTPIRITDHTFLVDDDCELICKTYAASPEELAEIVAAVNAYPTLKEASEVLHDLMAWVQYMGGSESKVWERAEVVTLKIDALNLGEQS